MGKTMEQMIARLGGQSPAIPETGPTAATALDHLRNDVFGPWFPRCIDREYGGFLCDFDATWTPTGPDMKQLEFQARQTRVAALACRLFPNEPLWRQACLHGWGFLRGPMWDRAHGGWFYQVDRTGRPLAGGAKHGHGIAYGIHACLDVARTLGEPAALALAREAFDWFDTHAWDVEEGGYWGWLLPSGEPFGLHPDRAPSAVDPIGTPVEAKDVNVNGDTLEALTEMVHRHPFERGRERLARLIELLEGVVETTGCLNYRVSRSFKPINDEIYTGNELQATYRLPLAHAVLGSPLEQRPIERELLRHALSVRGPHGALQGDSQREAWWPQFELIRSLAFSLSVHPEHGAELLPEMTAAWSRLNRWFFDSDARGVFDTASPLNAGKVKGEVWKDGSHEAFALLAILMLERLEGRAMRLADDPWY